MSGSEQTSVCSHVPCQAVVVERTQESPTIFTLVLELDDSHEQSFRFQPGQFNMLYLHGVGEVAISIVSDPDERGRLTHTIRDVGRVTHGLAALRPGDRIGVRGPFGQGWPLAEAVGKHVLIATGGLGCAPVVAGINYLFRRRNLFGRITILQGVRHVDDLIWRARYDEWAACEDTQVLLAADMPGGDGSLFHGNVVQLFGRLNLDPQDHIAMLCGPEIMMSAAVGELLQRGFKASDVWVNMERNMHCADGLCGHCQLGPLLVCRDGPVFRYDRIEPWFGVPGL